jgi:hypothetical protein
MKDDGKMKSAIMVIASWSEIDLSALSASELREIIKSMVAVAVETLEDEGEPKQFPWQ